jgi:hypothetical protein
MGLFRFCGDAIFDRVHEVALNRKSCYSIARLAIQLWAVDHSWSRGYISAEQQYRVECLLLGRCTFGVGATSTSTSASWGFSTSRRRTCRGCCWRSVSSWAAVLSWTCWAWWPVRLFLVHPSNSSQPSTGEGLLVRCVALRCLANGRGRLPGDPSCSFFRRAGHAYYFLEDVYPRMTGRRPLRTPGFVKALFPGEDAGQAINLPMPMAPGPGVVRPPGQADAAAGPPPEAGARATPLSRPRRTVSGIALFGTGLV